MTQITAMKKNLAIFHQYATQSGFGMDARGVVTAAPSALNAYYAAHSGAAQFANAPLLYYDELLVLFGRKYHNPFSLSIITLTVHHHPYCPSSHSLSIITLTVHHHPHSPSSPSLSIITLTLHHNTHSLCHPLSLCHSLSHSFRIGDVATGEFAMTSVGPGRAPSKNLADVEQFEASTACSSVTSTSVLSTACSSVTSTSASTAPATARATRPYAKKLKTRHDVGVSELIREIISAQERFHTRMTPYDKAIQIFQERFMFGLTSIQESRIITLFAESDAMVRQFMSFNDEQRDVFVKEMKHRE
jgi:hypothetical protein